MKKPSVKIFLYVSVILVILSVSAAMCMADEIMFLNGDRLTGKLLNIKNTNVTFKPELMGTITFDISKTESISTDEPVKINFDNGTAITTTAVTFKDDKVSIKGFETGAVINVVPQEVFSVSKPGASRAANWTGSISGGFTKTDNDEDTTTFNSILRLKRRSPKHRLRMRGVLFLEQEKNSETRRDETTEENYTADMRYDYFFTKKYFWFASENYKRDIINDLDYRLITGSGLGYQWLDSATKQLDIIGGFAYTTEQYSANGIEEDNSYLSYLFGIDLDCELWDKLTVNLDATITPNVEKPSEYIARGFGGIKLMVTKKLFVNFNTIFEYNSKTKRADSTDTKFLLGFGWDFL
jgi:putative salt-induced outer membrane protein YdiY